ncbi:MAG: MATE family efflux transporter [Bacteroidales bacterium]|nr:MATE family efflux transporter [Bacteroidales bacterium]MCF8337320.1 MATE family efflux transporter [Bacteroidales bacterium]
MRAKQTDLTHGAIAPLLLKLTWPMIFGMLGMVLFNLADTYFIGKVGVKELAAMGFTFPVVMVISSLVLGVGIGTSSLISRSIVSESYDTIKKYSSEALLLGLSIVIIIIITGQLTIRPLFRTLGASEEIIPLIHDYMSIWYWGMIFVVVPMVGNNIIRATGDTFTPGMFMSISAIINIILDPFLILGYGIFPALSLKGAAIATLFGRGTGMILTLLVLIRREKILTLKLPNLRRITRTWGKILYIGGPATASILITPLSIGIVTRIVAKFGEEAVAAFGVVSRLEMFSLIVVNALGSVMIIFAGQNWGKRKISRLQNGLRTGSLFAIAWGLILFVISQIWAQPIASLFTDDAEVIRITANYLIIVSFSYAFQGILMVGINVFNGINKPLPSAGLTALRMFGLYIPLAWLASIYWNLSGVFWSAFLANIVVGSLTFIWLYRYLKKQNNDQKFSINIQKVSV